MTVLIVMCALTIIGSCIVLLSLPERCPHDCRTCKSREEEHERAEQEKYEQASRRYRAHLGQDNGWTQADEDKWRESHPSIFDKWRNR